MFRIRFISLVLLGSFLCGCSSAHVSSADPALTPISAPTIELSSLPDATGLNATETAEAFYSWYAAAVRGMLRSGQPLDPQVVFDSGYLSPKLAERITQERQDMVDGRGGADPILCAQDVPSQFTAQLKEESDALAIVEMTSDLIGHQLMLRMTRDGNFWVIDDIMCGSAQERAHRAQEAARQASSAKATRDGWHVYACPDYGFDISIPGDWVYQEHTADPNEPPLGPECVRLVTLLMPETWAAELASRQGPPSPNAPTIAPFTLEVIHGSQQEIADTYPPAEHSQVIKMGQMAVTQEVEALSNDLSMTRYLVEHPYRTDMWLLFTDPISGFPDRLAGNETMPSVLTAMIESIRFTR